MAPFTDEQREELRAAARKSQSEALAQSRRWATERRREEKSPVVRAAEHARRAQDAKAIAAEIVGPPRPASGHCQFCGAPCKGTTCRAHTDLT